MRTLVYRYMPVLMRADSSERVCVCVKNERDRAMTKQGIDYGMGQANVDGKTGIRFGVISQHALGDWWYEDSEAQYGDAQCPECQSNVVGNNSAIDESVPPFAVHQDGCENDGLASECECWEFKPYSEYGCADYVCLNCRHTLDSSECFPDEALGFTYDADGYQAESCLDSDVILTKSDYYTYAAYCSPCVPGACSLESPIENPNADEYEKCYAFNHDCFEDGIAPYRVWRVADDTEVIVEA